MPLTGPGLSSVGMEAHMHGLVRRARPSRGHGVAGLAVKLIGIGLFAGLTLVYCQFLLDACFRGLH